MITILGTLIGFISSIFPDIFGLLKGRQDNAHELAILKAQADNQKALGVQKLEEINANADIAEATALYKTYSTGIAWVDALNGSVRPVIAYAFFGLYAFVKFNHMGQGMYWLLWTEEDQAIFAGIISFFFGSRAMNKMRKV